MIIQLLDRTQAIELTAQQMVVLDNFRRPLVVVLVWGDQLVTSRLGDPDFEAVLERLGIKNTVIAVPVHPLPISQLKIPGV